MSIIVDNRRCMIDDYNLDATRAGELLANRGSDRVRMMSRPKTW